jgi:MFS family permease
MLHARAGAGPAAPRERGGAFAALRIPQFRWLFASNAAFFFAMNAQMLVRSYLAYELTRSPLALGLVNLVVALPMLVVSPFGGAWADRVERRRLVIAGQLSLVASEACVLGLLVAGVLELWHMLVSVAVMGCIFPFIMPARQALVVNAVGVRGVTNAMALSMGAMNASRVVGPVLAGLLIAAVGLPGAYATSLGLYGVAVACMLGVRPAHPDAAARRRPILAGIAEGFRFVNRDRVVLALLLLGIVPMFLAMPFQTLLVIFANDVWHVGPTGFGALQACAGVGGVLGSLFVAWRGDPERRLRAMMLQLCAFAAMLALFAASPWFGLALPLVLGANVFASVFNTRNSTAVQLLIPDHVRGRIMSFMMMSFGLTPLGTLPMSAIAEAFGAPVAVAGGALWVIGASGLFWLLSPALRTTDARAAEALAAEVETARAEDELAADALRREARAEEALVEAAP